MTDLLLAIFYVDIEQCTLALLLHVLPGYLQYRLDEISHRDDSSEQRHYFFVKESSRFFFLHPVQINTIGSLPKGVFCLNLLFYELCLPFDLCLLSILNVASRAQLQSL